jgi:hypothetical protein
VPYVSETLHDDAEDHMTVCRAYLSKKSLMHAELCIDGCSVLRMSAHVNSSKGRLVNSELPWQAYCVAMLLSDLLNRHFIQHSTVWKELTR